jgi:TrmH family RNA methyltransferase
LQLPSLTRNQIKHLRGLRSRKYRHAQQQFVAEGPTILAEILAAAPPELRYVVCTPEFFSNQTRQVQTQLADKVYGCDVDTLARISSLDTPASALAVLDIPHKNTEHQPPVVRGSSAAHDLSSAEQTLNLYLDGIRDPGNLGTILRVADWFGHSAVYLSEDCVDVYNAKTIQASMGAFLRVRICTESLNNLRILYPAAVLVGTRIDAGCDALTTVWPRDTLLVIGSESHGIREAHHPLVQRWLSIPRGAGRSGAESLNAAVATGILCASHLAASRNV